MRPEAVVLDIGNVLIGWDPEGYYDRLMPRADRERLFAEAGLDEMNARIDRGAPFRETIYAQAEAHPRWADHIRRWYDDWIGIAAPAIWHSVKLQRTLRAKGIPVFALSNFGTSSFDYAQTQYDFLTEFDRFFISGRLGVMKPEPEIYAIVEDESGIAPDRLLFTDDRPANVEVAAARGWRTHRFDGPEGWAARLVAEGLLTEGEARP